MIESRYEQVSDSVISGKPKTSNVTGNVSDGSKGSLDVMIILSVCTPATRLQEVNCTFIIVESPGATVSATVGDKVIQLSNSEVVVRIKSDPPVLYTVTGTVMESQHPITEVSIVSGANVMIGLGKA